MKTHRTAISMLVEMRMLLRWTQHYSHHPHLDGCLQHGPELFLGEVIDVEEMMAPGWGVHPHTSVGLCLLQDCTGSDCCSSASAAPHQPTSYGCLGPFESVRETIPAQSRGLPKEPWGGWQVLCGGQIHLLHVLKQRIQSSKEMTIISGGSSRQE